MAAKLEIYKCNACGNIVHVLHGADGQLECCGKAMQKLTEKTADQGKEKHVPVIEKTNGGVKVKVGDAPHPMAPEHYIELIELLADGKSYIQFLNPGDAPEAFFNIQADNLTAREHCTIHGLWKGV